MKIIFMTELDFERERLLSVLKQFDRTVEIKMIHKAIVDKYHKLNIYGLKKIAGLDNPNGEYASRVQNSLTSVDTFMKLNLAVKVRILRDLYPDGWDE